MKVFGGLFVLFTYIQFSKLVVHSSVQGRDTQIYTSDKASYGRITSIDEDAIDGDTIDATVNNRRIQLDLKDIDLQWFDVTDEYYNKYLTKYINVKDHTKIVKIVDGDVLVHEPETGETFLNCSIRANKLDLYLRYEYRDTQANEKTIILYKANEVWHTVPKEVLSDPSNTFGSDKCSIDKALRESEDDFEVVDESEFDGKEEVNEGGQTDLSNFSHTVDSLYVKFVLDINSKEDNEKVNFRKCYIHDNHSLVYIIKNGYRLTSVKDQNETICKIPDTAECYFVQVLLKEEAAKFVFTMSKEGSKDVSKYYEKEGGKWISITSDKYYNDISNYKKQFVNKTDIVLDIRTRKDTKEVLFIDSDYDNVHTHIYAPMPGYSFKEIKIKGYTIWKRTTNDCQMAMVKFLHNYPHKVHLVMPTDVSDLYFHLKKKYLSYKIKKNAKSINFEGEFKEIDEKKFSDDMVPLRFQPPIKFPSNKFVVDITSKKDNEIHIFRHGMPLGVETYFYMAKDGYKIAMVREGENEIWKSHYSDFASFVVVLLSKNETPVLVRVVTFDSDIKSKHRYYVKVRGKWKEIDAMKYKNSCDRLYTFISEFQKYETKKVIVDLGKNSSNQDMISLRYRFDGMDTKVIIPNNNVQIQKVVNNDHVIWQKGDHDCVMVICRLNGNKPYFVNIVKKGETADEFYYVPSLQRGEESNNWKTVIFDHIFVQISEYKEKPYIQHSYKEHQIDISGKKHDEACCYKTGDFYNIPSSYFIMKTGHGITKVLDGKKELWRSKNGEYAPYLVLLFHKGKPRLLFIMVNKPSFDIHEMSSVYLEKKGNDWEPMYGDLEFNFVLNNIEVKDKRAQKFELDINQRKDDDRVLFFDDKLGVRNIVLYFPKKNYRLVKLTCGNDVILETGTKDYMISVKVYLVNEKPYLIRIRYRHDEMRFKDYERVGGKWVEIDSNSFLVKTLTLNDVFFSEVNVLKSSLFDKVFTKLGSDKMISEGDLARKIKKRFNYDVHFDPVEDDVAITPVEKMFELISEHIKTERIDRSLYIHKEEREKDECVLDISNINLDRFTFYDNIYKRAKHRVVDNKYECKVIKVIDENGDIHPIRDNQELFRCHIYNKDGRPEMLEIFTYDEHHRLNHFIYTKRDGLWDRSYWRQSDLLYKLYRYMSRPVKKHLQLELGYIDESNFQVEEKNFASYIYRTMSPNSDVTVSRVTHQGNVIHTFRKDQALVWCSYNEMGENDDILDLFVTDLDGKLYCYSYKRDSDGWNLNYTHKSTISSLHEFSSNRFKALVNHRLIDTCDGEVLDDADKTNIELDIDGYEATVEYTLNDIPCKMFRPKKNENVTRIIDGDQELLNMNDLKSRCLLASFLYLRDGYKSGLYLFLVDQDGNVERMKYHFISDSWVISNMAPDSYQEITYELDNVSNKEVIEYLDDSFNCKFTKDLEDSISRYENNPSMPPYLRPPIWILDLNDVDNKKFKVTRSTKDSIEYYHITPKPFVLVDRIMYDDEIIHDLTPGDMLDRVTVSVDKDNEYEISCDVESPDGTLKTYTRKSNEEPEPGRILYTPTRRSLYRPGNLYEIAGSHVINIAKLRDDQLDITSDVYKDRTIRIFKTKPDVTVTRVFDGVRLVSIAKPDHRVASGTIYYRKKGPALMMLKIIDCEGKFEHLLYVKVDFEWMLVETYEVARYLRKLYSDREYLTDEDVDHLCSYFREKTETYDDEISTAFGTEYGDLDLDLVDAETFRPATDSDKASGAKRVEYAWQYGLPTVLDIIDINPIPFKYRDNMFIYNQAMHRAVEVNYGFKISKVVEGEMDIHKIKSDQELFRCVIYLKAEVPHMVDIFIYDAKRRLSHFIYTKRDGLWDRSYWRQSDLLYKLYRYMSRPVKKHLQLELGYIDESNFQVEEKNFASYIYRTMSPNSDVTVSRVTHQGNVIHTFRKDQALVWCSYNEMGENDDILDLFVTDLDGKLYCYSYKRDSDGWNLNYTHKSTISSLHEFSSNRFKALVNHRLIDTCDGEVLDDADKTNIELDIDGYEATVEYTLNDIPCKMFRPKKNENVTRIIDGDQELLNMNDLKSRCLLASFLYLRDGYKSGLYLFLVDQDGNVERMKYHFISDSWVISNMAPDSYQEITYELDNVSNKEVIEYLDDSFNCKFTKDLEDSISRYENNPSMPPYLRPPIWILDLNDVDNKKFKVTRSTKDSIEYYHITPKPFVLVDRIMYDDEIIHDLTPGDMLDRVTVSVDKDNEYEISCDVESPDGTLKTYTRKSNEEPEPGRILYTPTRRSLYRPGNLYEIAGSHVINIANITNENCVLKSIRLKNHIIKKFYVNEGTIVTRIFEGVKLINIVKPNHKLVAGTVFYDQGPAMVILKCRSQENEEERSVYVKLGFDWSPIEEQESERYLRSLYPDGKYFTVPEVRDLLE
ncbi:hypothetical protein MACK_001773 [Theileria orientalis]|uniref:Uncharacterized protein n=1 Tax=Theileria orientalis TaxID=68886 RepID=A0A976MCN2_THEOR|nr:hypothetical protein MACK_001773 [Theileria orientalis]